MRAQSPCAVQQDGTARPQIVQNDPALAELLRTQPRSSGRVAIINTSFNLHDEPIVCSPRDAARAAAAAEIVTVQVGDVVCMRRNAMTSKQHTRETSRYTHTASKCCESCTSVTDRGSVYWRRWRIEYNSYRPHERSDSEHLKHFLRNG
jgi:hypothetical protein